MLRGLLAALAALVLFSIAPVATAQVTIGSNASGAFGSIDSGVNVMAQVITPPKSDQIVEYSFWARKPDTGAPLDLEPVIYEWNGTTSGAEIWSGPTFNVTSASYLQVTFFPNIALDHSKQYLISVRAVSNSTAYSERINFEMGSNGNYQDGYLAYIYNGSWSTGAGSDLHFSATFRSAPAAVPTMTEWAMILLGLILASGAAVIIQRRRIAI